jgi:hypothetical protein
MPKKIGTIAIMSFTLEAQHRTPSQVVQTY